jgi:hypothetical protein
MGVKSRCARLALAAALCSGCGAKTDLSGEPEPVADMPSNATAYVRYTTGDSPLAFIDACGQAGAQTLLPTTDDNTASVGLPFSFLFYRTRTSSAWVSSNGVLGFAQPSASFSATCLPSTNAPLAAVFPFWADLMTRPTGICVATVNSGGSRRFVATWQDAHFCCGDDPTVHLTYSVVLTEGSNTVDVLWTQLDLGTRTTGATVGTQNETGTVATQVQCNASGMNSPLVRTGGSVRFTPVP